MSEANAAAQEVLDLLCGHSSLDTNRLDEDLKGCPLIGSSGRAV
ncbi:hypothetical protein [Acrocarpospora catenulata]|nr:hypothetical protein [Acrocarpospora catenulata]